MVDSPFYAGIFVESGARPNIVSNTLHGGDTAAKLGPATTVNRGLGVLFILGAKGLLGKNQFEDFTVAPVMVFTRLVVSHCTVGESLTVAWTEPFLQIYTNIFKIHQNI